MLNFLSHCNPIFTGNMYVYFLTNTIFIIILDTYTILINFHDKPSINGSVIQTFFSWLNNPIFLYFMENMENVSFALITSAIHSRKAQFGKIYKTPIKDLVKKESKKEKTLCTETLRFGIRRATFLLKNFTILRRQLNVP